MEDLHKMQDDARYLEGQGKFSQSLQLREESIRVAIKHASSLHHQDLDETTEEGAELQQQIDTSYRLVVQITEEFIKRASCFGLSQLHKGNRDVSFRWISAAELLTHPDGPLNPNEQVRLRCRAVTHNNLGLFYYKTGQFETSLRHLNTARKTEQTLGDQAENPGATLVNLSQVYVALAKHAKCKEISLEAAEVLTDEVENATLTCQKEDAQRLLGQAWSQAAVAMERMEDHVGAMEIYEVAVKAVKKAGGQTHDLEAKQYRCRQLADRLPALRPGIRKKPQPVTTTSRAAIKDAAKTGNMPRPSTATHRSTTTAASIYSGTAAATVGAAPTGAAPAGALGSTTGAALNKPRRPSTAKPTTTSAKTETLKPGVKKATNIGFTLPEGAKYRRPHSGISKKVIDANAAGLEAIYDDLSVGHKKAFQDLQGYVKSPAVLAQQAALNALFPEDLDTGDTAENPEVAETIPHVAPDSAVDPESVTVTGTLKAPTTLVAGAPRPPAAQRPKTATTTSATSRLNTATGIYTNAPKPKSSVAPRQPTATRPATAQVRTKGYGASSVNTSSPTRAAKSPSPLRPSPRASPTRSSGYGKTTTPLRPNVTKTASPTARRGGGTPLSGKKKSISPTTTPRKKGTVVVHNPHSTSPKAKAGTSPNKERSPPTMGGDLATRASIIIQMAYRRHRENKMVDDVTTEVIAGAGTSGVATTSNPVRSPGSTRGIRSGGGAPTIVLAETQLEQLRENIRREEEQKALQTAQNAMKDRERELDSQRQELVHYLRKHSTSEVPGTFPTNSPETRRRQPSIGRGDSAGGSGGNSRREALSRILELGSRLDQLQGTINARSQETVEYLAKAREQRRQERQRCCVHIQAFCRRSLAERTARSQAMKVRWNLLTGHATIQYEERCARRIQKFFRDTIALLRAVEIAERTRINLEKRQNAASTLLQGSARAAVDQRKTKLRAQQILLRKISMLQAMFRGCIGWKMAKFLTKERGELRHKRASNAAFLLQKVWRQFSWSRKMKKLWKEREVANMTEKPIYAARIIQSLFRMHHYGAPVRVEWKKNLAARRDRERLAQLADLRETQVLDASHRIQRFYRVRLATRQKNYMFRQKLQRNIDYIVQQTWLASAYTFQRFYRIVKARIEVRHRRAELAEFAALNEWRKAQKLQEEREMAEYRVQVAFVNTIQKAGRGFFCREHWKQYRYDRVQEWDQLQDSKAYSIQRTWKSHRACAADKERVQSLLAVRRSSTHQTAAIQIQKVARGRQARVTSASRQRSRSTETEERKKHIREKEAAEIITAAMRRNAARQQYRRRRDNDPVV